MTRLYQVFMKPNDINGNPYRLVWIYQVKENGQLITEAVCEERTSYPSTVHWFERNGVAKVGETIDGAKVYNFHKKLAKQWRVLESDYKLVERYAREKILLDAVK